MGLGDRAQASPGSGGWVFLSERHRNPHSRGSSERGRIGMGRGGPPLTSRPHPQAGAGRGPGERADPPAPGAAGGDCG